jgi:hypothetical protein
MCFDSFSDLPKESDFLFSLENKNTQMKKKINHCVILKVRIPANTRSNGKFLILHLHLDLMQLHVVNSVLQLSFSKPVPQKTDPPLILANFLSPCQTFLCKGSFTKPATSLNQPFLLVLVLAGLEKFHCACILTNSINQSILINQ